ASVGATLGIRFPRDIPARWAAPIGRDLVLSPGIVNLDAPKTLDSFTDLVIDVRHRLDRAATELPATDPVRSRNGAATSDGPSCTLEVKAAYYSMTDEHRNLDTWFLPDQGPVPDW